MYKWGLLVWCTKDLCFKNTCLEHTCVFVLGEGRNRCFQPLGVFAVVRTMVWCDNGIPLFRPGPVQLSAGWNNECHGWFPAEKPRHRIRVGAVRERRTTQNSPHRLLWRTPWTWPWGSSGIWLLLLTKAHSTATIFTPQICMNNVQLKERRNPGGNRKRQCVRIKRGTCGWVENGRMQEQEMKVVCWQGFKSGKWGARGQSLVSLMGFHQDIWKANFGGRG